MWIVSAVLERLNEVAKQHALEALLQGRVEAQDLDERLRALHLREPLLPEQTERKVVHAS